MSESTPTKQKSLYAHFQCFIENNRRDNQQHHTGWHERLRNIYVSHYQLKNPGPGKTELWRKYSEKK